METISRQGVFRNNAHQVSEVTPSGERTVNYRCTSDLGWLRYGDHMLTSDDIIE